MKPGEKEQTVLVVLLAFRKLAGAPLKVLEAAHEIDSTRLEIFWGVTHEFSMQLRSMGPEYATLADQMDSVLGSPEGREL